MDTPFADVQFAPNKILAWYVQYWHSDNSQVCTVARFPTRADADAHADTLSNSLPGALQSDFRCLPIYARE